jgi:hypothetical protein
MSRRAALQTYHAIQASGLATAFNDALKRIHLAPGDHVPEMTEPEGPSTAGGIQAMQHVRLVPHTSGGGHATLVVGHANQADKTAELRTFDHVDAVYRQRFKRPLEIERARYDEFVGVAKAVLEALQFRVALAGPPAELADPPRANGTDGTDGLRARLVATGVAVMLTIVGLGLWKLLTR